MSEPSQPPRSSAGPPADAPPPAAAAGDGEALDALPVLANAATFVRPYPTSTSRAVASEKSSPAAVVPVVHAAAAAAGGFVAGAAVVGLVSRHQRKSAAPAKRRRVGRWLGRGARGSRAPDSAGELLQIVGSRSLLVDVHLLGGRG